MNEHDYKMKEIKSLATLLDTKFQGPFGIRFGLDALIGLIPGIGDFVTSALSIYIISQAARLGVGPSTLMRMGINIVIENIVDLIPFFGNLFDFYWKANIRNLALLEKHLAHPVKETFKSRVLVFFILMALIAILIAAGYASFRIIEAIYVLITSRMD